jgi:hypothetical protein
MSPRELGGKHRRRRVAIIVWTAQIGVWFARMILRILMYIGWLIGGFMMRQMEYDADAWEIKLAGSETFERTQRKLATLSAAMEKMYKQIHAQWEKTQQLPDNLSELLRQNTNRSRPRRSKRSRTHPAWSARGCLIPIPRSRIASARRGGRKSRECFTTNVQPPRCSPASIIRRVL